MTRWTPFHAAALLLALALGPLAVVTSVGSPAGDDLPGESAATGLLAGGVVLAVAVAAVKLYTDPTNRRAFLRAVAVPVGIAASVGLGLLIPYPAGMFVAIFGAVSSVAQALEGISE